MYKVSWQNMSAHRCKTWQIKHCPTSSLDFFEDAYTEFATASYYFVEGVLKNIPTKGYAEEMFERNLER